MLGGGCRLLANPKKQETAPKWERLHEYNKTTVKLPDSAARQGACGSADGVLLRLRFDQELVVLTDVEALLLVFFRHAQGQN